VQFCDFEKLINWRKDATRSLYVLDVRTREEFERSHLAGSRHAPGGQLVQATDEYVGVRHSRIVLVDPELVRAIMTASWLNQMGWNDVHVLEEFETAESGPRVPRIPGSGPWQTVGEIPGGATVVDLSTSLRFRGKHIPGAWWAVRSRLAEAHEKIPSADRLVLTSEDGVLAHLAAPEAQLLWPQAEVLVLDGGNKAWKGDWESGLERATTATDDVWYKPYYHATDVAKHAREYLEWEVALVEQIKRDPTISFRTYG
jgi:rhodanese-related sulfurtransferase